MFKIKEILILLVVIIASSFVISTAIIYAVTSDYYRIDFGQTATIDEWGICKNITRTSSGDIFIPTRTQAEWEAFINNATGVTFADCTFCIGTPTVTDIDGNIYNTVQVGSQCWMKENLRTGARIAGSADPSDNGIIEKYCYNDLDANCATDGGLYQWNETMGYVTTEGVQGVCPSGWHVPTDAEWHTLENYLADIQPCNPAREDNWGFASGEGQCATAGAKLRAGGTSDFQGISAGARDSASGGFDGFHYRDQSGFYWSSSLSSGFGRSRHLSDSYYSTVSRSKAVKSYGFSIRCLED